MMGKNENYRNKFIIGDKIKLFICQSKKRRAYEENKFSK